MLRKIVLSLTIIMLVFTGINNSYAAFPIAPAHNNAAAPAKYARIPKTFSERAIPQFFSHLKAAVHPDHIVHSRKKTGWPGIVSLVCGILAFPIIFASLPVALLLTLLAIVFGAIGVRKRRHTNTGLALAGLLLGCIGFLLVSTVIIIIAILNKIVAGISVM